MNKTDIWKKRGNTIKVARTSKGLLQKDIAKYLGVATNTISGYETGSRKIDFDDIKKICKLLDIDINFF